MTFEGVDLIAESSLPDEAVASGLSRALNVEQRRIAIINSIADVPESGTADVVCLRTTVAGSFTELLSIDSQRDDLMVESVLAFAQAFVDAVQVRCLSPMEGHDPYLMWLLEPGGGCSAVELETTSLDEERYVVRGARTETLEPKG